MLFFGQKSSRKNSDFLSKNRDSQKHESRLKECFLAHLLHFMGDIDIFYKMK